MKFSAPRGTRDILPQEIINWEKVEGVCRSIFATFGYAEIRTPIFEEQALFARSLGQVSDIVQKQMLTLESKDPKLCLRPEATAAVVRSYLEQNLHKKQGLTKFFYIGPMFRGERPQKGRLRQFHHIGVEALGITNSFLDAEIISLAAEILDSLGIKGYLLKINSLGCKKDKEKLAEILRGLLKEKISLLCGDCKNRFNKNIFRILDCKNDGCQEVVRKINLNNSYLCPDCQKYFTQVKGALKELKVPFEETNLLVRGLDYYTHTVFEISHKSLGSQDAIAAGGRYNNLIEELGGPDLGAMGFAFGFERLLMLTKEVAAQNSQTKVYIATLGEEAYKLGFILLNKLRKAGISSQIDYESASLKGQLRQADDLKSKLTVLIGDVELENNIALIKDMSTGNQEKVGLENLTEEIKKRL